MSCRIGLAKTNTELQGWSKTLSCRVGLAETMSCRIGLAETHTELLVQWETPLSQIEVMNNGGRHPASISGFHTVTCTHTHACTHAHTPKSVASLGHIFQPTNIKQVPAMTVLIMLWRQPGLVWISQFCLILLAAEILGGGQPHMAFSVFSWGFFGANALETPLYAFPH